MPSIETILQWADLALAALLLLVWGISYLSARAKRNRMRELRRSRYCANPTTRGGYCHNPPVTLGSHCRANHPSALPVPVVGAASFGLAFALAMIIALRRPIARFVLLWIQQPMAPDAGCVGGMSEDANHAGARDSHRPTF